MPRLSSHVPKKQKTESPPPEEWEQNNNWGPELKYFDSELAATNVVASTTTWAGGEYNPATIGTLFLPVRGTGITNRVGRTVKIRWIQVVGQITIASQSSSSFDQPSIVRLLLVQNTQTSGTQTQAEDVISSGTNIVPINMFSNLASLSQYKILKDQRFYFQNDAIWGTSTGAIAFQSGMLRGFDFCHHFFPFSSDSFVNFKSDLGDYRDVLDNSFSIIGICTNGDMVPQISYKCRVGFNDN